MNAGVFQQEEDGLWHIHCPTCALEGRNWCAGKYSDRIAAMSNAAFHVRSQHRDG